MPTIFKTLSNEWNAEPNAPNPIVEADGSKIVLSFGLNSFKYPRFRETDRGKIVFNDCWRYRLGPTNDEGWYLGQCRFSREAPKWGEFYEIEGDLLLDDPSLVWKVTSTSPTRGSRHFLFYFRDSTFECDALNWTLTVGTIAVEPL